MVTLYDVPATEFIETVAERLTDHIDKPEWVTFVKSGDNREFPPERTDFWFVRAASVFRRVAIDGPVGVGRLATFYGGPAEGSNRYQVAPVHHSDASRKVIRTILQQLEEAGFVERPPNNVGRVVTPAGQSFLDEIAGEVIDDVDRPELERYI